MSLIELANCRRNSSACSSNSSARSNNVADRSTAGGWVGLPGPLSSSWALSAKTSAGGGALTTPSSGFVPSGKANIGTPTLVRVWIGSGSGFCSLGGMGSFMEGDRGGGGIAGGMTNGAGGSSSRLMGPLTKSVTSLDTTPLAFGCGMAGSIGGKRPQFKDEPLHSIVMTIRRIKPLYTGHLKATHPSSLVVPGEPKIFLFRSAAPSMQ